MRGRGEGRNERSKEAIQEHLSGFNIIISLQPDV